MTRRLANRVAQFPLPTEIEWALDNAIRGEHVYHLQEHEGKICTLFVTTAIELPQKGRLCVGIRSHLREEGWETYAWAWWTLEVAKGNIPITPEGAMDILYVSPNEKREK